MRAARAAQALAVALASAAFLVVAFSAATDANMTVAPSEGALRSENVSDRNAARLC